MITLEEVIQINSYETRDMDNYRLTERRQNVVHNTEVTYISKSAPMPNALKTGLKHLYCESLLKSRRV